ncbi:MAG TPA: thiamine phosphate synthase, partial [Terriglobia bacterium]|nr:thiamine phosphate synthase [Terriglobia bacterium]
MIRCYVTDRRQGDLLTHVARAVAAGVDMIQVREKDLSAVELLELVCRVRDLAAGSDSKILVNGRLDIALAAGIHGVHLPGDGLPAA